MHIANDFVYGVSQKLGEGLRISVLSSNVSVLTCLANDEGYENIFSHPLSIDAEEGDVLIVLSGSGNSENILKAIQVAKQKVSNLMASWALMAVRHAKWSMCPFISLSMICRSVKIFS